MLSKIENDEKLTNLQLVDGLATAKVKRTVDSNTNSGLHAYSSVPEDIKTAIVKLIAFQHVTPSLCTSVWTIQRFSVFV